MDKRMRGKNDLNHFLAKLSQLHKICNFEWEDDCEIWIGEDVEVVVAYFQALYQYFPAASEEELEKVRCG